MRSSTRVATGGATGARFALAAAALLGLLVAQVVGMAGANAAPDANVSASTTKQLKKLKKRVAALEQGPTGPAGGELRGSYPNPSLVEDVGFTRLSIDGPCAGGHTGNCPGKWDSDSITMTRKDGSPTEVSYNAFYNGEALGFHGSNGDDFFISGTGFMQIRETSFQGNPPANSVRIYPRDNAGQTEVVVRYSDGEIDVISQDN